MNVVAMNPNPFLGPDFLLENQSSRTLYHDYAEGMPIIDYHCHLSPKEIWENRPYENIAQLWLGADHYKWRAMRFNGIPEEQITGKASPRDKFCAWASTVSNCIGNPLYHWTHLELQRFFGITESLDEDSAQSIWEQCNKMLATPGFRPRDFMTKSRVEMVGTTDDPCDDLEYHRRIAEDPELRCKVLPSFRPDRAVNIEHDDFIPWLEKLSKASNLSIDSMATLKRSLAGRMEYFAQHGCRISDCGIEELHYQEAGDEQLESIFAKRLQGKCLSLTELASYKTALWRFLGEEYGRRNWVMQLHIGAMRSNNRRMLARLGPDTGFDSIADHPIARPLVRLLDSLEQQGFLPRTVLYNLNPRDNHVLASICGSFQGELPGKSGTPCAGKIQFGSAWWFSDQRDGMTEQMRVLANLGLLPHFIGMLTDSRSFLSYPRHEYFRRILCNLLGTWIENGEYPSKEPDRQRLGTIVQNISYHNARNYFDL